MESRDLLQDMEDIRNGIRVYHASDSEKSEKKRKSEQRQIAKEKRIAAMEKKILEIGYGNMDSFEQNRACKLLDWDRIDELEVMREQNLLEKQNKPQQMSLEDLFQM